MDYVISREQCEQGIKGVCEGCGGGLKAIETVDNSGHSTFWQGCERCSCFRGGIEPKYFEIARQLVEKGELLPYSHLREVDCKTPEGYLNSQTAGLSHIIKRIHILIQQKDS